MRGLLSSVVRQRSTRRRAGDVTRGGYGCWAWRDDGCRPRGPGCRCGGDCDPVCRSREDGSFPVIWPARNWLRGGFAGGDIEGGQCTPGQGALFGTMAQRSEPGMTSRALGGDRERGWRRLRENPDYVADWRENAAPTVREAPPHAFRRQTQADLEAARWNLLAWEDPHHLQWAELFWTDVAMVEARVAEPGAHAWRCLVLRAGATFTGSAAARRRARAQGVAGPRDGAAQDHRRRRLRPGAERPRGRGARGRGCASSLGAGREPGPGRVRSLIGRGRMRGGPGASGEPKRSVCEQGPVSTRIARLRAVRVFAGAAASRRHQGTHRNVAPRRVTRGRSGLNAPAAAPY